MNIHWKADVKAETPIIWPPDAKRQLIRKDWERLRQEEKGAPKDEMVGRYH